MRKAFVVVHRWAGLFIAVFLFIAGLTGALISWDHELDEWLNPHLFDAKASGTPLDPFTLVERVERADPKVRVTYFQLAYEEGHNTDLFVEPRIDPKTSEPYAVDYNQVFITPAGGEIAGRRFWGAISLDSENILPFLYKLHYSMHIPDFWGIDTWGIWFMGIVGIVWMFDCFVGFYLTLPSRRQPAAALIGGSPAREPRSSAESWREWWERWKPAWRIKRGASSYRLNLDLHRAFGLWLWAMLFILAFTSISMNLGNEVVRPILRTVSSLTPDAFDDRAPTPANKPIEPRISFAEAVVIASREARSRGWTDPPGSAFYGLQHGLYAIAFHRAGEEHGAGGMGASTIFVDGVDGSLRGDRVPWKGTAADIFMQLQFPLHSGRIAGVPGRAFLSFMGLVVALLSATGIVIWFKKRAARIASRGMPEAEPLFPEPPGRFALLASGIVKRATPRAELLLERSAASCDGTLLRLRRLADRALVEAGRIAQVVILIAGILLNHGLRGLGVLTEALLRWTGRILQRGLRAGGAGAARALVWSGRFADRSLARGARLGDTAIRSVRAAGSWIAHSRVWRNVSGRDPAPAAAPQAARAPVAAVTHLSASRPDPSAARRPALVDADAGSGDEDSAPQPRMRSLRGS